MTTIAADAELQSAIARRRASRDDSHDAFLIEEIVGRHGQPIAEAARLLGLSRTIVVRHAQERAREVRATIALLPDDPPDPRLPLEVRTRRFDEVQHRRYLVGVVKNLVAAVAIEGADAS